MASKGREVREFRLDKLVIGEGQVRARKIDADIDELAASIRIHGLLEPILVCQCGDGVKFEVLAGQRRVLAHQKLGRESIMGVLIDRPLDENAAKAISLTENIIRRDLDVKDVIDACTSLYKRYGSARAVADETGIPYARVLKHLKYDRLAPELQERVDTGQVALDTALKAQDTAADEHGNFDPEDVVDLAEALETMSGAERRQILHQKKMDPSLKTRDILEIFWKENEKDRQIVVTVPESIHRALQERAKAMRETQDKVAAQLICDAVSAWNDAADLDDYAIGKSLGCKGAGITFGAMAS